MAPAFKQRIYRNDDGRLIATINQDSIGDGIATDYWPAG
ncbi:hypothetical protein THITH_01365 [Thioalkalivibrio paradoxus ARh 1]|uniref:Uncharacterized protein n=1 Tax=Thioalkalivibrio paradoxus ARh 1 TaxID=713585 RepID=W0DS77_9GAMM|nr:hypothetical protein THITH_01365 [Thioalkalivibrio paradoxus ARh 1]